ncbi:LuxR C-terminal-related transcriptional regulator, partial [Serratia marcescens]|uniref:LuxR C-terminal-related transcriptional regulator n=1 Tax=Serratia marcescens TaxID=615 RepID=UPI001CA38409
VKEQTVIEYIHAGMTVSQIAQKLSRSVKTISAQKRNAMRKMGVDRDSDLFRININKTIRRSN